MAPKIVAEIGTCFEGGSPHKLVNAVRAALNCGADLVKIQYFTAERLAARRNVPVTKLVPWELNIHNLIDLVSKFPPKTLGVTCFSPLDVPLAEPPATELPLAFVKTATQEWQCAALAQEFAKLTGAGVPLYVSVPRDACLVVGNYSAREPITWLYAEPKYPSGFCDYQIGQTDTPNRLSEMRDRLPGKIGLSDHTMDSRLAEFAVIKFSELAAIEKHFCYHETLRGKTPDSGPWAMGQKEFTKFAETLKR